MDENIGLIVKAKVNIYPDATLADPVKAGTKGVVYSIMPENYTPEDSSWFIIFQSGEQMDFCDYERNKYLEITTDRISGSDKNRLHGKKLGDVVNDVVKKRIKL